MPTNRLMTIHVRLGRLNKMVLTLMPRMSLRVIYRLMTFVTQRRQNHTSLISLRKRRLRRNLSETNNLLARNGTTHRRQVLSNHNMTNRHTISMTSVNHPTTSMVRSLLRKNTHSLHSLLRTGTRRKTNITNRLLPNHTRSVTQSSTPRSLTNNKRRRIKRTICHHNANRDNNNVQNETKTINTTHNHSNNNTYHNHNTKDKVSHHGTNSRTLRIEVVRNRVFRVIRRTMTPRITNRVIRSRPISLSNVISNVMTSVRIARYCPQ